MKQKLFRISDKYQCYISWAIIIALFIWLISSIESYSVVCINGVEYIEVMLGSITPSYELDGSIKSCEL